MRFAAFLLLAMLLAAWAVFLLLDTGGSGADGMPRPRTPAGLEASADRQEAVPSAPGSGAPTLSGRGKEHSPIRAAVPATVAAATPRDTLTAAWVEVTVELPADWKRRGGVAYALPAGAEGADESEHVAQARLDGGSLGPIRIPLVEAGVWDVGFVGAHGHAMARDVAVARGEVAPVRLTFPGYRPVRVQLADSLPSSSATGSVVRVEFREIHDPPVVERGLPGRHEGAGVGCAAVFRSPGAQSTPSLPPDRAFRVRAYVATPTHAGKQAPRTQGSRPKPSVRYVSRPDVVAAGGSVEVRRLVRGVVDLRLRYEGEFPPTWGNWGTRLHFHARMEAGTAQGAGVWVGPNRDPPFPTRAVIHADPGVVHISWKAWGILAGALEPIVVRSAEVVRRDVVVRIDPNYNPFEPPDQPLQEAPIRLRVRGIPEKPRGRLVVFGLVRGENGRPRVEQDRLSPDEPDPELWDKTWHRAETIHAVLGCDWASQPTRLSSWGKVEICLEPAGLVQVAPAVLPPPGLGAVRIRRRDGQPFGSGSFEYGETELNVSIGREAPGQPGTILGPLPPGDHVFEIWVGCVKRSTRRVAVEAGRITVLRILD